MAALSKPEVSTTLTGGSEAVEFKVTGTINWREVAGADSWSLFILVIERDGKTDLFDVRADGSFLQTPREGGDDVIVKSPILKNRPANNGPEDFEYTWTRYRRIIGNEAGPEEYKARVWLVPNGTQVYNSDWSMELKIDMG